MTVLNVYEYVLIELNKVEAPSLLLEDFIYFLNKATQQYANKMYNLCEYNQQKQDDLLGFYNEVLINSSLEDDIIVDDYFHSLGCDVTFINECGKKLIRSASKKTANISGAIMDNYYFKPSFRKPYYSIITLTDNSVKIVIDFGISTKWQLESVNFKYLKTPPTYIIENVDFESEEYIESTIPFSNYVCYEIINDLVKLILENASDPRLQSNMPVNQSIANPGQ